MKHTAASQRLNCKPVNKEQAQNGSLWFIIQDTILFPQKIQILQRAKDKTCKVGNYSTHCSVLQI